MKKLFVLIFTFVMLILTGSVLACENCDCGCQNGEKCTCKKECVKDCDCNCHKGEKCSKEDCKCKCHKDCSCENCDKENCNCGKDCKCKKSKKRFKNFFKRNKIKCNCEND